MNKIKSKKTVWFHKRYLLQTDNGEVIQLRASYDKQKFFIRSAHLVVMDEDVLGNPYKKYIELEIISAYRKMELTELPN